MRVSRSFTPPVGAEAQGYRWWVLPRPDDYDGDARVCLVLVDEEPWYPPASVEPVVGDRFLLVGIEEDQVPWERAVLATLEYRQAEAGE